MNALEVQNISLAKGGLKILDNVNLVAEPGHVTGVIGPNGAGKTTLFNVISGFMKPDSGKILFEGNDVTGVLPEKLCGRGLVRTFQKVRGLPTLTVRDNVLIGALNRHASLTAAAKEVDTLLADIGLEEYAEVRAETLSIGLRKRLEVARVLSTKPTVVLLDEVMGGLVPSEVDLMMDFIKRLPAAGIAVVLVEHHMKALMGISDKVIVIERGRNLAKGTPTEVSKNPEVIRAYLGGGSDDAAAQ